MSGELVIRGDVSRLEIGPGEALLVRIHDRLTFSQYREAFQQVSAAIAAAGLPRRFILLDARVDVQVIDMRPEDLTYWVQTAGLMPCLVIEARGRAWLQQLPEEFLAGIVTGDQVLSLVIAARNAALREWGW